MGVIRTVSLPPWLERPLRGRKPYRVVGAPLTSRAPAQVEQGPLSEGWSRPMVPKPERKQKHTPSQVT